MDILVGTPLLAGKLIKSERLQLAAARFLVLDEGDRLLDEQFVEQVDAVLAACTNPHLVRNYIAVLISNASRLLSVHLLPRITSSQLAIHTHTHDGSVTHICLGSGAVQRLPVRDCGGAGTHHHAQPCAGDCR